MEKLEFENKNNQSVFDAILQEKPNLNFSILQTILRKKDIKIDGRRIDKNVIIQPNQIITIFLPNKKTKQVPIVYQDENILIVDKPQGMEVTKEDKAYKDSECLEDIFDAVACHRLDKNTQGVVVMAKDKESENLLLRAFKEHSIKKEYLAIVSGVVKKEGESFVDYIKKEEQFVIVTRDEVENSKIAKTSYNVLKQKNGLSLLSVQIETGRTHQIRAQLAFHKIYVLGDEKYGEKSINKKFHTKRQCLCAKKVLFCNMTKKLSYLTGKEFCVAPQFDFDAIAQNNQ